ncbi:MAG TPA: molybdopterin molybdenumtransferase MoeA, partial [Chromatiaceae bacterium]|nr:molybdopterin molybdenumtransferase MoeA [Chromatiaceae bacterium]
MSDCDCGGHGAALKPLEEALALMLGQARVLSDVETVTTLDALDRVLAESCDSPIDVPGWDNSAMDGYALNTADLKVVDNRLTVTQRIPAGSTGQPLA